MPTLVIKPRARTDLFNIWRYISEGNPDKADEVLDTIQEQFKMLSEYTHAGRTRKELGRNIRSFPAGDHVIFIVQSKTALKLSGSCIHPEISTPLFRSLATASIKA
jgi:toxin ParE1/3/4